MKKNNLYSIVTISILTMFASFVSEGAPPAREVIIVDSDVNPIQVEIPTQVHVSSGTTYRFRSISTAADYPDLGINRLNRVCQQEFGTDARMCTSEEFDLSISDIRNKNTAWIKPTFISVYYDQANDATRTVDYSGLSWQGLPEHGNCHGFQTSNPQRNGLVLRTGIDGYYRGFSSCDVTQKVVCCTPQ